MSGFLLLSPTGSGKSWVHRHDPFFKEFAIDGDHLIDWPSDWRAVDWTVKDREHLNTVLARMRSTGKCVCWYVGTTAVADALDDGRLHCDQVAVVLLPESEHRHWVVKRNKSGHGWDRALEHRTLCETLVREYELPCFTSFTDAAAHVRASLLNRGA